MGVSQSPSSVRDLKFRELHDAIFFCSRFRFSNSSIGSLRLIEILIIGENERRLFPVLSMNIHGLNLMSDGQSTRTKGIHMFDIPGRPKG